MSSSALPQTLHSITNTKINELSKQRILFQKRKDEILHLAANSPDLRSKAQILLEGVTKLKGYPGDAFDQEDQAQDLDSDGADDADEAAVRDGTPRATHVNIRRFLLQSRYDPSVSDGCLRSWIGELERELRFLPKMPKNSVSAPSLTPLCSKSIASMSPITKSKLKVEISLISQPRLAFFAFSYRFSFQFRISNVRRTYENKIQKPITTKPARQ